MLIVSDSKNRLMRAALELVFELGYKNTSTKKIAQAANMNEASIFRLFGSKRQLILDAIYHQSMSGDDLDLASIDDPPDFRGRLERFVGQCLDLCIRQLPTNRTVILSASDIMDRNFHQMILARMLQVEELFRLFLERERQRDGVELDNMEVLPEMVFSRLYMAAMYFYRPWDKETSEEGILEDKRIFVKDLSSYLCSRFLHQEAG